MKYIRLFSSIFLFSILFTSCKKEFQIDDQQINTKKTQSALENYLDNKIYGYLLNNSTLDSMRKNILWEELEMANLNNDEILYFLPVNYNSNSTGFVFIKNSKTDSITNSYLSEIKFENNKKTYLPGKLIAGLFGHNMFSFSGSISLYTTNNKFLFEEGFSHGKFKYRKKIINNDMISFTESKEKIKSYNTSSNSTRSNGCTVYYEVTYWSDMTVEYEVIGITCDSSPCEQTRVIDKNTYGSIQTFCYTGGGGSSGGVYDNGTLNIESIYVLPENFSWKYPKFYSLMKTLSFNLQTNYRNSLIELSKITKLSQEKILEMLILGKGPRIEIKNLNPSSSNSTTIFGQFDKYSNTIYIDQALIQAYEAQFSTMNTEAMTFFISIVILHETVHYGVNENINLFKDLDYRYDLGRAWEIASFGTYIDDLHSAGYYLRIN